MRIETAVCPITGSKNIQPFATIPHAPAHCNLIWDSVAEAKNAALGDIELAFSPSAGHVFNQAFNPEKMAYDQAYENSLHFSPRFQQYATKMARHLIDTYSLHDKQILEIGSGQGDFLKLLCELGPNWGTGFDRSYVPKAEDEALERVTFVQDFYSEAYGDYPVDLLACRHVLEHIENPIPFLKGLRRALGNRTDTAVFFEVPNMAYTLRELAIWDIIYEHCGYYTPASIRCAFSHAGFETLNIYESFGGQYLCIEAKPIDAPTNDCPNAEDLAQLQAEVNTFGKALREKIDTWQQKLAAMRQNQQKVVVWGAGSKGNTFLNMMNTADIISYIIDINPRKEGKFVVGTAQQIKPPAFLQNYEPDVVILMNPLYEEEIRQTVSEMGLSPRFELT